MDQVVLVDEMDREIGTMEKLEAHQRGLLHRAFSILLFNNNNEILLQRRALNKYHSGGLWTNTCCSHPKPKESIEEAAHRRLKEEMGIDSELDIQFKFIYTTSFDSGLIENELDYVLFGRFNGEPELNPEEAMDYKYLDLASIKKDVQRHPDHYTVWFKIILDKMT